MKTDMTCDQIIKAIRADIKKELPGLKFSVRMPHYRCIEVSLMAAPFDAILGHVDTSAGHDFYDTRIIEKKITYAQLNHYYFGDYEKDNGINNGQKLTKEAWDVMSKVCEIQSRYNYDRSDLMTDYFDVGFYFHLEIGRWDKPFVNTLDK